MVSAKPVVNDGGGRRGKGDVARILVTGAAGFVGRSLCPALVSRGHQVVAGIRTNAAADRVAAAPGVEPRVVGDIAAGKDWRGDLRDIDVVIHLAQRAHRRADARVLAGEPAAAGELAEAAARAGVKRFVYISSIKAMGEATPPGRPFRPDDRPLPQDAYGRAKLATEQVLRHTTEKTGLDLAVLRPPLIYGPGVGGNFRALLRLAGCGLPLPFANVDNRRSLIFIDNFVALVATATEHAGAGGQTWLACDGADLSTPDLIRLLARGQHRTARLFGWPQWFFAGCRASPGTGPILERLTGSLQVDDRATRAALGWRPAKSVEEGLLLTARAYAAEG